MQRPQLFPSSSLIQPQPINSPGPPDYTTQQVMSIPGSSRRNLFIAFDAFGTLFTPRGPIGALYGEVARRHGICRDVSDDEIMGSFHKAFKHNAKERPNYGKEVGMDPTAWWGSIITDTFTPFLPPSANPASLPHRLIPDLLTRFASRDGYTLYPDVIPVMAALRALKQKHASPQPRAAASRKIVVGIITNSDDRVAGILRSFGLRVGHVPCAPPLQEKPVAPQEALPPLKSLPPDSPQENDVDLVLTSYDCGFEKPHRGIFDAASALVREHFDGGSGKDGDWDMVYIGDELSKDVVGAEGAGWTAAFLIDREGVLGRVQGGGKDLEWVKIARRGELRAAEEGKKVDEDSDGDAGREVYVLDDLSKLKYYIDA